MLYSHNFETGTILSLAEGRSLLLRKVHAMRIYSAGVPMKKAKSTVAKLEIMKQPFFI